MIIVIDNYDSFVYNLAQYLGELGWEPAVFRNDALTLDDIEQMAPSHIVISPGPGTPLEAGISNDVIRRFKGRVPILGVCLGHQCIGYVYGGRIIRAKVPVHGKKSPILHDGKTIFRHLPEPLAGGRYHSLVIDRDTLPAELEVSARTGEGEIMAVRDEQMMVEGIQFHPESILSDMGHDILRNFLDIYHPAARKRG